MISAAAAMMLTTIIKPRIGHSTSRLSGSDALGGGGGVSEALRRGDPALVCLQRQRRKLSSLTAMAEVRPQPGKAEK